MMARTKRNETLQSEAPRECQPEQLTAIGALMEGVSDEAASARAGVARSTLARWRKDDPVFIAALNAAQRAAWAESSNALRVARAEAVAVIVASLHSEDERARLSAAWKLVDFLRDDPPKGPTSPEGVEQANVTRLLFGD